MRYHCSYIKLQQNDHTKVDRKLKQLYFQANFLILIHLIVYMLFIKIISDYFLIKECFCFVFSLTDMKYINLDKTIYNKSLENKLTKKTQSKSLQIYQPIDQKFWKKIHIFQTAPD